MFTNLIKFHRDLTRPGPPKGSVWEGKYFRQIQVGEIWFHLARPTVCFQVSVGRRPWDWRYSAIVTTSRQGSLLAFISKVTGTGSIPNWVQTVYIYINSWRSRFVGKLALLLLSVSHPKCIFGSGMAWLHPKLRLHCDRSVDSDTWKTNWILSSLRSKLYECQNRWQRQIDAMCHLID